MKVLIVFLMVTAICCIDPSCDTFQRLEVGQSYTIEKRGTLRSLDVEEENEIDFSDQEKIDFGDHEEIEGGIEGKTFWPFRNDVSCRFVAEAPIGYKVKLECNYVFLSRPKNGDCKDVPNKLRISPGGFISMVDVSSYCGISGKPQVTSLGRKIVVEFSAEARSYGRFKCKMSTVADSCQCGVSNRKNSEKVVGGAPAELNEYPMVAAIKLTSNVNLVHCGGSIISTQHVLSAAHCFIGVELSEMRVILGEHIISDATESPYMQIREIERVKNHEEFNSDTNENDIALIFLKSPITFNYGIRPVCLPFRYQDRVFDGEGVTGIGWGTTEFAGPPSDILREVDLQVEVSPLYCKDKQICTYANGKDLCQRDSGGPILFEEVQKRLFQIGVVSNGIACASDFPSVNTKVSSYLDWIQRNTEPTIFCAM